MVGIVCCGFICNVWIINRLKNNPKTSSHLQIVLRQMLAGHQINHFQFQLTTDHPRHHSHRPTRRTWLQMIQHRSHCVAAEQTKHEILDNATRLIDHKNNVPFEYLRVPLAFRSFSTLTIGSMWTTATSPILIADAIAMYIVCAMERATTTDPEP